MENQANSTLKQSLLYGGILGLVSIIISVIAYVLDMSADSSIKWVNSIVQIIILVLGIKNYRDQHLGGYISYGKALGTGTLIAFIGSIIAAIYTVIFVTLIDPEFVSNLLMKIQEQMAEKGMTDEQMEMAIKYQTKFMTPGWMAFWVILMSSIFGFLFSLVIAAFLKKNNESFEANFK